MNEKKCKIYKTIMLIMLLIGIFSIELLFCNSIFVRSLIHSDLPFSPYVFSLPRLLFYCFLIIVFCKYNTIIITNCINRGKTTNRIINIVFFIIYFILSFLIIYLAYKSRLSIMNISIVIVLITYCVFLHIFIGKSFKINVFLICLITFIYSISCQNVHLIDEVTHFPASYNLAHLNFNTEKLYFDDSLMQINILSDYNDNQDLFIHYKPNKIDITGHNVYNHDISSLFYHIPAAIGIAYSELLGGTIMDTFYFGRIFSCLFFIILISFFLKIVDYKKYSMISILTIPLLLMMAGTYNVDGIGYAAIALFIAYIFKIYKDDSIKFISNKQLIIIIMLFSLIAMFKSASYAFVALLLILIKDKLKKKDLFILLLSIFIILFFVIYFIYFNIDMSSGDSRGGEVSIINQLSFAFSNIFNILLIPIYQLFNTLLYPGFYEEMSLSYFYGKYSFVFVLPYILFVIYMSMSDKKSSIKEKILYIITFIILLGYTSAALYLSFTPVGKLEVSGYQARYFFQLLPMLLFCFSNNSISIKKTKMKDYYIILFIIFINIIQIMFMIHNLYSFH